MSLINRIKSCQTSKELDLLRIEIVRDNENFEENQKAFIRKKSSLKRNGHTPNTEGYSVHDLLHRQRIEMKKAGVIHE